MAPFLGSPPPTVVRAEKAAVEAGVRRSERFNLFRIASGRIRNRGTPRHLIRTGALDDGGAPRVGGARGEGVCGPFGRQCPEIDARGLTSVTLNIGMRQRWRERMFLASYIADALVCAAHDLVLSPHKEGSKRPVLLVPGWCGRTRSFRKMAERLVREGYPVYPVPLGSQLGCIDRKARLVSKFLDLHGLEDVYVVAHSMGGLISVRSMMKGETRIRKLVTMGTPYRGTHVIYLGYAVTLALVLALSFWLSPLAGTIYLALFLQIPSLYQMQPSSDFLEETLEYLNRVATPVQCIYAVRDQIVIHDWRQAWSPTRLGRPDDLCLPEYGHMNLFMGESGIELVARLLERYDAADASLPSSRCVEGTTASVEKGAEEREGEYVPPAKCLRKGPTGAGGSPPPGRRKEMGREEEE